MNNTPANGTINVKCFHFEIHRRNCILDEERSLRTCAIQQKRFVKHTIRREYGINTIDIKYWSNDAIGSSSPTGIVVVTFSLNAVSASTVDSFIAGISACGIAGTVNLR